MTKMAMLYIALYFGNLAGALRHPMYPMVAYLTFYYMPPHLNWWGKDLPDLRYSLLASAVLAGSLLLHQGSLENVKREKNPARPWLMAWGANSVVVTAWALNAARSWIYTGFVLKLLVLYALIPAAVRTRTHFDLFATVHVVGASYWGYKAWDNPKREAGRLMEVGGPDSQNDNMAAAHLLTVIPFVALFVLVEKRKVHRALYALCGAFIVNVFILCNSRGATVGLVMGTLVAILVAGKGKRLKLIGTGAAAALAVLMLADPEFITRQQTTINPTDNSAQSRWVFWNAGVEMVKDYPFGGGGRTFHQLAPRYIPQSLEKTGLQERSPHNTYIQLATDWGLQGAAVWFAFVLMTVRMLHTIRKRAPADMWFFYRSLTLQVALAGTLTAGFFSNRLLGESIYWMCALTFALYRIQSTELEATAGDTRQLEILAARQPRRVETAVARHAGA